MSQKHIVAAPESFVRAETGAQARWFADVVTTLPGREQILATEPGAVAAGDHVTLEFAAGGRTVRLQFNVR